MDELIGLKDAKERSDNKILTILNKYFDKFVKGIKLFYNMTFTQKIKCIFEMGFYLLFLFLIFIVLDIILVEIIRKLLYLLPDEILIIMIQTFEGVFYIIYVIFTVYVLVKLYKIRYLDYYENYLIKKEKNNEDKNIEVVENKKEKVNIK